MIPATGFDELDTCGYLIVTAFLLEHRNVNQQPQRRTPMPRMLCLPMGSRRSHVSNTLRFLSGESHEGWFTNDHLVAQLQSIIIPLAKRVRICWSSIQDTLSLI